MAGASISCQAALEFPETPALYSPLLTIPGFDSGYAQKFDGLLDPANDDASELPSFDGWGTRDGQRPTCGELIAWRHPDSGNLHGRASRRVVRGRQHPS